MKIILMILFSVSFLFSMASLKTSVVDKKVSICDVEKQKSIILLVKIQDKNLSDEEFLKVSVNLKNGLENILINCKNLNAEEKKYYEDFIPDLNEIINEKS